MAALWEEYAQSGNVAAVGSKQQFEIFHNEVDDHVFASAPITIVDGIVTIMSDLSTDMVGVKLGIFHELFTSSDITQLGATDPSWWYRFMIQGGPLVFRLRSKRTIPSEHKLWIDFEKKIATNSTTVNVGMELLMVRHQ